MRPESFSEPTCFISYSWDDEALKGWVRRLASDLQNNGVRITFDAWDSYLGMDLPGYMERAVRESDFVILVCTPEFAAKANAGKRAVGYEKTIIAGAILNEVSSSRKFIPVLRRGVAETSIPTYLQSKVFQDFSDDRKYEQSLSALLRHIYNQPEHTPPPLGPKPDFYEQGQGHPDRTVRTPDAAAEHIRGDDTHTSSPRLPWRAAPHPTERDDFLLLDWRMRLTPLIGRDNDLRELLEWAGGDDDIRVRFLFGSGGAGKSRLAFEAVDALRGEGWEARQIHPDQPHSLPDKASGTFWVVDYPEAHRWQVRDLLRDLARAERVSGPIRVLLLSRRTLQEWQPVIDAAAAASICDVREVRIGPLEIPKAVELFGEAARRFAAYLNKPVPSIGGNAVADWLNKNPETHLLPLFVVAAALHCTDVGTDELSLTGGEIVRALVRRERTRLNVVGQQVDWGETAASRLVGLATVVGCLDVAAIRRLVADGEIGLPAERAVDSIKALGFWRGEGVPAPSPDIVAAELLFTVLEDRPDKAAEWLWACLADMTVQNVDRLGRIAYDILTLRGPEDFKQFAGWLASAVGGRPERANKWRAISEEERLPLGVPPLAVAIVEMLLQDRALDEGKRAKLLHTLSNRRWDTGDTAGAFEAGLGAVEIYEKLAAENLADYEPDYARSLRRLSIYLRDMNDATLALEASRDSVKMWRKLASESPENYEHDLALSLQVFSICLGESGLENRASAIGPIRDAVEIWRRLAAQNPARYQPDLAQSLNNLSFELSGNQDSAGALKAVNESVSIWRGLTEKNPARYEQDLALALSNLSSYSLAVGDEADALKASSEAVRLYRKVAMANPTRYESHLAQSLDNQSRALSRAGNSVAAVDSLRNAVEIWRRLAAHSPSRNEYEVRRLDKLFHELCDKTTVEDAFDTLRIAEETVFILQVRGKGLDGTPIYAYVAIPANKLESFMEAQKDGTFYPEEFGVIIESGEGEPSSEVIRKMEEEYGFDYEGMIDIPDPEKGREIVSGLKSRLKDE